MISLAFLKFVGTKRVLHSFYTVQLLPIYLSFLKIVHHCSSQKGSNSKGTQKMVLFKTKVKLENDYSNFIISSLDKTVANSSFRLVKEI